MLINFKSSPAVSKDTAYISAKVILLFTRHGILGLIDFLPVVLPEISIMMKSTAHISVVLNLW